MLVITSCTGSKAVQHRSHLTLEDFRIPSRLIERERDLAHLRMPVAELYTGEQHVHLMRGIRHLRERHGRGSIAVNIISAGYGLVPEDRLLAPYEATFHGMPKQELRAWAGQLGIPEAVREAAAPFPLVIFLLGDEYLQSIAPPLVSGPGQRVIFLAKPILASRLTARGVTVVAAGNEAK